MKRVFIFLLIIASVLMADFRDKNGTSFFLTNETYDGLSNYETLIQKKYGQSVSVVDWNYIKKNFSNDIVSFLNGIGMKRGESVTVKRNGKTKHSGTRAYFITRHEGNKPSYYLAHDNIRRNYLDLGSWSGERRVLLKSASNQSHEELSLYSCEDYTIYGIPISTIGTEKEKIAKEWISEQIAAGVLSEATGRGIEGVAGSALLGHIGGLVLGFLLEMPTVGGSYLSYNLELVESNEDGKIEVDEKIFPIITITRFSSDMNMMPPFNISLAIEWTKFYKPLNDRIALFNWFDTNGKVKSSDEYDFDVLELVPYNVVKENVCENKNSCTGKWVIHWKKGIVLRRPGFYKFYPGQYYYHELKSVVVPYPNR